MQYSKSLVWALLLILVGCADTTDQLAPSDNDAEKASEIPPSFVEQRIQPSDTGAGIDIEPVDYWYHHVVLPENTEQRKNVLVLHMVGSAVAPQSALGISRFAAGLGYGVLNLRYPNKTIVGLVCEERVECPEQYRGETLFGEAVMYAAGRPIYDEPTNLVSLENSVINRLVNLLDYLANQAATKQNPDPGYWSQFLLPDDRSPYVATHRGNVYPDWSKIVVSGHSQGGGMASMLAMALPKSSPVRRVIMFASPNDNTGSTRGKESSPWLLKSSATPVKNYWGLRHTEDTNLGPMVKQNWSRLGGLLNGGVGGFKNSDEMDIGDGSVAPLGAQRLVISESVGSAADAHSSTVDDSILPTVQAAWTYLFTANGTD